MEYSNADYLGMKKNELIQICEKNGIKGVKKKNKNQIIEMLMGKNIKSILPQNKDVKEEEEEVVTIKPIPVETEQIINTDNVHNAFGDIIKKKNSRAGQKRYLERQYICGVGYFRK